MKPFADTLKNPETFGTSLLIGLLDTFGFEFLQWEPDTLIAEARDLWKIQIPAVNRDKIWALTTVLTTNLFYKNLEVFISTCNALNNSDSNFETYDPATVHEICWALAETSLLYPADPKEDVFGWEIPEYIKLQLDEEGFSRPPKMLTQYVQLPDRDFAVDEALASEGVDTKAYWDSQQEKATSVDRFVRGRLLSLLQEVHSLPLRNADRKGLSELLRRAEITLKAQELRVTEAAQTFSQAPQI